jgi:hypothetical protein
MEQSVSLLADATTTELGPYLISLGAGFDGASCEGVIGGQRTEVLATQLSAVAESLAGPRWWWW